MFKSGCTVKRQIIKQTKKVKKAQLKFELGDVENGDDNSVIWHRHQVCADVPVPVCVLPGAGPLMELGNGSTL